MIWIDYAIIGVIFFSTLVSLFYGFIREMLSLVTWIFAFFISSQCHNYIAVYLTLFEEQTMRSIIAAILILVATILAGSIVSYICSSFIERTGFFGTDRILGVFFGLLRGILIVSVVLFCLDNFTNISYSQDWQQSKLIPKLKNVTRWFVSYLQDKSTLSYLYITHI